MKYLTKRQPIVFFLQFHLFYQLKKIFRQVNTSQLLLFQLLYREVKRILPNLQNFLKELSLCHKL